MSDIIHFDERDHMFSRRALKPGTGEYLDYYAKYPDLKEIDDKLRSQKYFAGDYSPSDYFMCDAPEFFLHHIGLPQVVDGIPAESKVKLSPERAAEKIKQFVRKLGADLAGISELKQEYVYSHRGRKFFPEEPYGSKIELNHRFAISLGFREDLDLVRCGPKAPEYLASMLTYKKSAETAVVLAGYIRSLGYPARAHHYRNYQLLPVPIAIDGGLGELARCGFLLTKEHGNCLRISTITTDLPLECDRPVDIGVQDFCDRCKLCAESCPSQAIPKGDKMMTRGVLKWTIDPVKCFDFWHKAGTDCGMCIGSCPWSEPVNLLHKASADLASRSKIARILLLWTYPLVYGKYTPTPPPDWFEEE